MEPDRRFEGVFVVDFETPSGLVPHDVVLVHRDGRVMGDAEVIYSSERRVLVSGHGTDLQVGDTVVFYRHGEASPTMTPTTSEPPLEPPSSPGPEAGPAPAPDPQTSDYYRNRNTVILAFPYYYRWYPDLYTYYLLYPRPYYYRGPRYWNNGANWAGRHSGGSSSPSRPAYVPSAPTNSITQIPGFPSRPVARPTAGRGHGQAINPSTGAPYFRSQTRSSVNGFPWRNSSRSVSPTRSTNSGSFPWRSTSRPSSGGYRHPTQTGPWGNSSRPTMTRPSSPFSFPQRQRPSTSPSRSTSPWGGSQRSNWSGGSRSNGGGGSRSNWGGGSRSSHGSHSGGGGSRSSGGGSWGGGRHRR